MTLLMMLLRYLAEQLLPRELGQISQAEAQVGFQVADVGGWRADLRGAVAAEEHWVT